MGEERNINYIDKKEEEEEEWNTLIGENPYQ